MERTEEPDNGVMKIMSDMAAILEEQDEIIGKLREHVRRLEADCVQLLQIIEVGNG